MRRQVTATRELISLFLVELEGKVTSPSEVIEAATRWFVLEYSKKTRVYCARKFGAHSIFGRNGSPFRKSAANSSIDDSRDAQQRRYLCWDELTDHEGAEAETLMHRQLEDRKCDADDQERDQNRRHDRQQDCDRAAFVRVA
jgi:hypothetical protein